jgi:hypothetical protein
MAGVPMHDAKTTVRIDVGRIYLGADGGGFVNPPNDTMHDFGSRQRLHALLDQWLDEAEQRLAERIKSD